MRCSCRSLSSGMSTTQTRRFLYPRWRLPEKALMQITSQSLTQHLLKHKRISCQEIKLARSDRLLLKSDRQWSLTHMITNSLATLSTPRFVVNREVYMLLRAWSRRRMSLLKSWNLSIRARTVANLTNLKAYCRVLSACKPAMNS